jgi:hypothetical protein
MNTVERFDDAFSMRTWGPASPEDAVTVIFKRRHVAALRAPGVSSAPGVDDAVAEAKVRLVEGKPAVMWRQQPTSREFTAQEFEAAAIRGAGPVLTRH